MTVLNPLSRPSPHIMDDSDLWGALLYVFSYGAFLALSGRFAWGYIYGIALFGTTALHWIFALMTPAADPNDQTISSNNNMQSQGLRDHADAAHHGGHFSATLTFSRSASVLGYCFLPLVFIALLGVAVPMDSVVGYFATVGAVAWCTYSSSGMFVSVGRMQGMRGLVAYPTFLFYLTFGVMGVFSSRGLGALEKVAG